ncbi:PREDICTED: thioredoxin-interacting protein, partial [Pygoscelis adeliae]|uniref:thioredoxin-interacting protein n=1 Tax=Pygoscelis adeliae TaxID=9238 RepID=UPI0004F500D3
RFPSPFLFPDGDGSVILRPGNKYEYKFGFELPQGPLGTTFKGKYGCVDYWVKAFLERPSFPTQEIKKRFEVMDPVDVNTPELLSPVAAKKEKKVSCMFIPDGRVSVSAQIDRKGFCEAAASRSGIGSRSSSMASQTSSEMSWVDLNLPDAPEAPPCYLDIVPEDHRLESPTTPLLDDPESFDSPIFMYAPEFKFMPPPTYTEVDPCIANNNVQ